MADKNSIGSASTSAFGAESSGLTIGINVKTLESQVYSFQVNRNISIPSLKEKVANETGVPAELQRLIFKGRVLKDDHMLCEYHVEDGDTLHLVTRPPGQPQTPTGPTSGEVNFNIGNRACKYLRRRCPLDCVLAPYFPANNPQRFASVHKIFGASNTTKMLEQLRIEDRETAANCLCIEASHRVEDPVYGIVKIVDQLRQQVNEVERQLAKTRAEIAFYRAQTEVKQSVAQEEPYFGNQDLVPDGYQLTDYPLF